MKRRQAYKNAVDCIVRTMAPLAFDANVVAKDPENASPSMRNRAKRYSELAETLKYFETALQQKELL